MKTSELLLRLLKLEEPWVAKGVKVDYSHKRLHVWLVNTEVISQEDDLDYNSQTCDSCAENSNFQWDDQDVSWFHLGLGDYGTKVHTTIRIYAKPCNEENCVVKILYLGKTDLEVTDMLAFQVVELLSKGAAYSSVCNLFNIPLQTVWAIRQQFDSGNLNIDVQNQTEIMGAIGGVTQAKTDDLRPLLPGVNHDAWLKLLAKDNGFKTRSLSLKFLLTKIRNQINNVQDEGSRKIKIGELRHYFDKHQRALSKEIAQLDDWVRQA